MVATASARGSESALARLIHPVGLAEFVATYREQRPLLVCRDHRDHFGGLFSVADFDRLMAGSRLGTNTVRILKDGREIPPAGAVHQNHAAIESACQQFASGATLSFQHVHERFEPVAALCRMLAHECSAAFQANAYLTPPGHQGLGLHHDTHDVFVVQTAGSKHWKVYGESVSLPLRSQRFDRHTMQPGPVAIDASLKAGDTLYLPRGFVHEASSTDETSLHLTIGVHAAQLGTLLSTHLTNYIEATPAMRRSLPFGFAVTPAERRRATKQVREALDAFTGSTDPAALVDDAALSISTSAPAPATGRLLAADASYHLTCTTAVRPRTGAVIDQRKTRQHLTLTCQGRVVRFPVAAATAVDAALSRPSSTAQALPGPLDPEGKLLLLKTLLAEGMCELDL